MRDSLLRDGVAPEEFRRCTGISEAELLREGGRIRGDAHRRVLGMAERHAADFRPLLGWSLPAWTTDFESLALVCANSPTQRQALAHFLHLRGLIGECDDIAVLERPGGLQIEYLPDTDQHRGRQALANFIMLAHLLRHYGDTRALRFEVELEGGAPMACEAMNRFFGSSIRSSQSRNLMRVASSDLDTPFPHFNAAIADALYRRAGRELAQLRSQHLLSHRLEEFLHRLIAAHGHEPGQASRLALACEHIHVTRWTLRRRLLAEGTSYAEIERKLLREEARRLVGDTALPLGDISQRLGFASQSVFSRFFRREFAVPPQRYRELGLCRTGTSGWPG